MKPPYCHSGYITREVEDKANAANEAFLSWRETGFPQRVEKLRNAVRILTDQKVEYAVLIASEMSKPVQAGRAEIEKCAWGCDTHFLK